MIDIEPRPIFSQPEIDIIRPQAPRIAELLERGEPLPRGVRPITFNFVVNRILTGEFQHLNPRTKELLDIRVATATLLKDLTKTAEVDTRAAVAGIVRRGMVRLLKTLPAEVQRQLLEHRVLEIGIAAHSQPEEANKAIGRASRERWRPKKFKAVVKRQIDKTSRKQKQKGRLTDSQLEEYGPYLGGFFEIAGTLGFSIGVKEILLKTGDSSFHTQVIPFLKFTDNHRNKVETFRHFFGGSVYPFRSNEWQLIIRNDRAIRLALIMSPYAPSRSPFTTAIASWNHRSLEEKEEIARSIKGYHKRVHLTENDYYDLVRNPKFSAGLIDNRGIPNDHYYPTLRIPSPNKPLLDALHNTFGGRIGVDKRLNKEAGIFFKTPPERLHSSERWELGLTATKKLLAATQPYHLLQREWVDSFLLAA